jgi:hypothetical protein
VKIWLLAAAKSTITAGMDRPARRSIDPLSRKRFMAQQYSKYQQNIIRNYYDNQETLQLQKLGEMVTELYLAEGKKRAGIWKRITTALQKLKVPASRIEHLAEQDNPALVAKLLEELLAKK